MNNIAQRIAEKLDSDGLLAERLEYRQNKPCHIDPKPDVAAIINAEIAPLLAVVSAAKEYLQASNLTETTERWQKLAEAVKQLGDSDAK